MIYKANAESCNRDSTREMEKGRGVKLVTAHETITIVLAIHKIRRTVLCFEKNGDSVGPDFKMTASRAWVGVLRQHESVDTIPARRIILLPLADGNE